MTKISLIVRIEKLRSVLFSPHATAPFSNETMRVYRSTRANDARELYKDSASHRSTRVKQRLDALPKHS
jgi:hypothetical protein